MITWIRKSVTRRIGLLLVLISAGFGYMTYYFWNSPLSSPIYYSFAIIGGFVLVVFIIVYSLINKPLKKLTKQMKLLLTGRSYKRITTNRIDEIGIIAQFFNEITENLENISKKLKEEQRMSSELEIASSIQKAILPNKSPDIPNLEVVAKSRSAVEVGGDSFDFIQRKDATYFYIGDVTGHGSPAALVMMMVNTLLHTYSEMYSSVYDIVVNTNRILKPRIKAAMFMTMVILKWDHLNKKMTYVGAGHEYILIYRNKTGEIEAKPAGGVALGMVPDNSKLVKEQEIKLEDGDMIILYTDGITEARNDKGEMYGIDRFKEAIKNYATQYGPEGVTHHVALDFSQYVGNAEQEDDITLMVLKYTEKKEVQTDKSTNWK
ncbi:SpoIIE family protein phosphatase [bacterium]|nr:SpoIIE family protein phosphatase [bacterium]